MSVEQIEACVLRAAHKLGYAEVRKHQAEAATKFMQGDDVFVSLPTGSSKSLIYSVLPFAFDELLGCEGSVVVVISPLISLMKNQVRVVCNTVPRALIHIILIKGCGVECKGD